MYLCIIGMPTLVKYNFVCLIKNLNFCNKTVSIDIYVFDYQISVELFEAIGVLMGIGILLLWCGLFGLLKHFESLHVS